MLPFMARKDIVTQIVAKRKDDGSIDRSDSRDIMPMDLQSACSAIIDAVEAKDAGALSSALMSAYSLMEASE